MELSIILSVYNMSEDERLENCLNSLLEQTISDYEILVVDDASTDGTAESLLDFAAHYPDAFQVILSTEHIGVGGARNLALKQAKGKWIAFMESCDYAAPDMYEKLLQKANKEQADMAACDYQIIENGIQQDKEIVHTHKMEQTGVLDTEKYKSLLLDFGTLCTKIYKRKLLETCGLAFPDYLHCNERAMECAIVLHAKRFAYVPEALYTKCVYTNEQELCNDNQEELEEYCEHYAQAALVMLEQAQEAGYLETYSNEIEYKFIELFYVIPLFLALEHGASKKYLAKRCHEMKAVFPAFEKNIYYRERVDKEKRFLIHIQRKNTRLMLLHYRLRILMEQIQQGDWEIWMKKAGMKCLGILLCLAFLHRVLGQDKPLEYDVVLLGDSIVANDYYGKDMHEMLSEALEQEVFNGGFGGSYLCDNNVGAYETMGDEVLSLELLTKSIVTGDFLVQKGVIEKISKLDYFEERLDTLARIDFDKTNTLIIEHGVNDYLMQIEPQKVGETLKEALEILSKRYPNMQIFVCSPTYCFIEHEGETWYCDTTDLGEYVLEDYIEAERQVCEELQICFIDNYHQDIITRETIEEYVIDGLHLNEAGRQIMADNIVSAMRQQEQAK